MMINKPTSELDDILKGTKPNRLDSYLKENHKYMSEGDERRFYNYFTDVLKEKNIKLKDVYSFAGVSESYGSQLLYGKKHVKDRDVILRFCLAGHFLLDEINRALKLYGFCELYSKVPRDACLIVAINNRIYDPYDIDEILVENGFEKITKKKKKTT